MRRIVRAGRRPRVRIVTRQIKRMPAAIRATAASPVEKPKIAPRPVTSLTLVGSPAWREPMASWLEYEPSLVLAAEIDPANRPKHMFDLPSADVVIVSTDAGDPDASVELALELQAKDRGTGIILVLSGLRDDMARRFSAYAGSWSLITSKTSADPVKLTFVVQSSARGIHVVEPAVTKMLEAGWRVGDADEAQAEQTHDPDLTVTDEAA